MHFSTVIWTNTHNTQLLCDTETKQYTLTCREVRSYSTVHKKVTQSCKCSHVKEVLWCVLLGFMKPRITTSGQISGTDIWLAARLPMNLNTHSLTQLVLIQHIWASFDWCTVKASFDWCTVKPRQPVHKAYVSSLLYLPNLSTCDYFVFLCSLP